MHGLLCLVEYRQGHYLFLFQNPCVVLNYLVYPLNTFPILESWFWFYYYWRFPYFLEFCLICLWFKLPCLYNVHHDVCSCVDFKSWIPVFSRFILWIGKVFGNIVAVIKFSLDIVDNELSGWFKIRSLYVWSSVVTIIS